MVAVRVALLAGLFAVSTWQVVSEGPLRRFGERAGDAVRTGGFPGGLAELSADLGNVVVAVPVLVGAACYVYGRSRRWRAPVAALLVLALVPAVVAPLKALIDRPGPPGTDGSGGFYPSGHAATALVAFGAAVLLLLPYARRHGRLLVGAGVLLVAANGFGLVRRGYHWPLDVVASWCLGGLLLIVLSLLVRRSLLVLPHGRPPT
ncbi:phosphatase PAP2 family protein [Streptomyces sp. KLOTTS4A1]|uniref:phosphatase PAP2 family protein n=1 Tax=Streptomyces sp. KLOTTS4A1 TaxID=3390996 RepID=UPI0039F53C3B